jgi:aarF domain-containing kinase
MFNTDKIRRACIPSANGHFSARALAKFYHCLSMGGSIDGVQILSPQLVKEMSKVKATMPGSGGGGDGSDWGLGVKKYGKTAFGHGGLGGSIALCDPASQFAIAVTVNKLTLDRGASRQIVNRVCELLKLPQFDGINADFSTT